MKRYALGIVFGFGLIGGCHSGGVVVEDSPPHRGGGPPPHAPAHGYRAKHAYHYYPNAEVYYHAERRLYWWLEGDGWKVGGSLPASVVIDLSEGVEIELEGDTPHDHHDKVKKSHPGKKPKKAPK